MEPEHIKIAKRLLSIPGIEVAFDAQKNTLEHDAGLSRGDTRFESVPLYDNGAETFTHYLVSNVELSHDDESDLSFYNACSWGEESNTLGEQIRLVRARYPDVKINITPEGLK